MFEYVLLDVPPILASSSGVAMLRHAQQLPDGRPPRPHHRRPGPRGQRAAASSSEPIGVVMNQVSSRIPKKLRRFFAM